MRLPASATQLTGRLRWHGRGSPPCRVAQLSSPSSCAAKLSAGVQRCEPPERRLIRGRALPQRVSRCFHMPKPVSSRPGAPQQALLGVHRAARLHPGSEPWGHSCGLLPALQQSNEGAQPSFWRIHVRTRSPHSVPGRVAGRVGRLWQETVLRDQFHSGQSRRRSRPTDRLLRPATNPDLITPFPQPVCQAESAVLLMHRRRPA
jgi:hypothetical protein